MHWPEWDRTRRDYTATVEDVFNADWSGVAARYMEEGGASPQRLALLGRPDTSDNLLAQVATQLSTPGRYGYRPVIRHASALANWLIGEGKALDRAMWAPLMQTVEAHAYAAGDCLLAMEATAEGGLTLTPIFAHEAWAEPFARAPGTPRRIGWARRLESRTHARGGQVATPQRLALSVFLVWELPDHPGEEPRFFIQAAEPHKGAVGPMVEADGTITPKRVDIAVGDDVTYIFQGHAALTGEAYPWRYSDGRPFIPIAWYRSQYRGSLWATYRSRDAFLATLAMAEIGTAVNAAVRAATGKTVVTWGLELPATTTQRAGDRDTVQSIDLLPQTMLALQPTMAALEGNVSPTLTTVEPSSNLQPQTLYLEQKRARAAAALGLSGASVTRSSSNPTSAAALQVSDEGRREYMAMAEPLYRAADLDFLSRCAALLNLWGRDMQARAEGQASGTLDSVGPAPVEPGFVWTDIPETGYSIEYHHPPADPNTMRAEREEADWALSKGLVSAVDLWMRDNPGATRDDAIRALAQVEVDRADVASAVAAATTTETVPAVEAMNGAQAQSFQGVLTAIRLGEITPAAAKQMLPLMFPFIGAEVAASIVDAQAGDGVPMAPTPSGPAPAPAPSPASPPAAAPEPEDAEDDEDTSDPPSVEVEGDDEDEAPLSPEADALEDALDDLSDAVEGMGTEADPELLREALAAVRAATERLGRGRGRARRGPARA